ncbi:MAG: NAD(+)/NADH kinase, partial [Candidatus Eisenbacteria bacterium]|nr:NAD(+)/NADH kinase [Candidatus Eisenbacteria bacterium]
DLETIRLRVLSTDASVHLLVDGRVHGVLHYGQDVVVSRSPHVVRLLQRAGRTFYSVLRQKLGWAATTGE